MPKPKALSGQDAVRIFETFGFIMVELIATFDRIFKKPNTRQCFAATLSKILLRAFRKPLTVLPVRCRGFLQLSQRILDSSLAIKSRYEFVSQKGSHIKVQRHKNGLQQTLIIPDHKELDRGTLVSIFKQAIRYIAKEELRAYFYLK